MSSFASLIKLSKTQNNNAAQDLAAAVAKREAAQIAARAEAAARDAKERQAEKERLKRRFEEEQKSKDRAAHDAEAAERREREFDERREREARAMLTGKSGGGGQRPRPTGGGGSGAAESSRTKPSSTGTSSHDSVATGAMGLTREEKRARQTAAWDGSDSRSRFISKKRKAGAFLPGGALNVEAGSGSSAAGGSGLSVRARLAASQSGLIKLNTNKRDMRSIDEISRDLQEKRGGTEVKKVITGVEAEKFGDWFTTKKDKEREKERGRQEREKLERERQERLAADEADARERDRKARERERERERDRVRSRSGSAGAPSQPQAKRTTANTPAPPPKPAPIIIATKPSTLLTGGSKLSSTPKEYKVTVKTNGTPVTSQPSASTLSNRPRVAAPSTTSSKPAPAVAAAKRRRSYNSESDSYDSEEEERERRRRARKSGGAGPRASGFDIWSIINPGKSRQEYLGRDVVSDDEDMEATGRDLEKEEKQSARIARLEDLEAEAEERRREESKRRKKSTGR